jgi:hypothetical protein
MRMLRGACVLAGERDAAIAALDRQVALTIAGCDPSMLAEDRAKVETAAVL